jgi:hypothetical protein
MDAASVRVSGTPQCPGGRLRGGEENEQRPHDEHTDDGEQRCGEQCPPNRPVGDLASRTLVDQPAVVALVSHAVNYLC